MYKAVILQDKFTNTKWLQYNTDNGPTFLKDVPHTESMQFGNKFRVESLPYTQLGLAWKWVEDTLPKIPGGDPYLISIFKLTRLEGELVEAQGPAVGKPINIPDSCHQEQPTTTG